MYGITTALRYDGRTNAARGVYYFTDGVRITDFVKIPAQFLKCSHPLLLPLLVLEIQADYGMRDLADQHFNLIGMENRTGYRDDNESDVPNDYRDLVKQLGKAQVSVHRIMTDMNVLSSYTLFIRQKLQHLKDVLPAESSRRLDPFYKMLEERIDFFQSNLELARPYSGVNERMKLQHTVVSASFFHQKKFESSLIPYRFLA